MRPLVQRIPQLHRLAVFDAVASAGNFTSAAHELQISQPAVSRHMAALAQDLDLPLFERAGRQLRLTNKGQELADAVETAFSLLEHTLADLDDQKGAFVFAVQPAMATTWVVPMLDQLEDVADTEIRLRIFERRDELDGGDWDVAIVPGTGDWPGWDSTLLFREAVRPFAAPSMAAKLGLGPTTQPDDLVQHTLLHIDEVGRPNMTWHDWFSEAGSTATPRKPRLMYNAYPTVIQEALAGNGIALGWQHLLSDLVQRGLLVPVGPVVQRTHGGHHVCWRTTRGDDRHRSILAHLQSEIVDASAGFDHH